MTAVKKRCLWVLDELKNGKKLRSEDLEEYDNCSRKKALRALGVLKDHGLIDVAGSSRKGGYVLTDGPSALGHVNDARLCFEHLVGA